MTTHPGKTPAQRRVLDEIGGGHRSPYMTKSTRDAMLREGLIYRLPDKILWDVFAMPIEQFEMPGHVHIAWCEFHAQADDKPKVQK